ncbi:MAG: hypothetical protein ACK5YR_09770 [Pirellula sp.]|jgi:hypothetical protein
MKRICEIPDWFAERRAYFAMLSRYVNVLVSVDNPFNISQTV